MKSTSWWSRAALTCAVVGLALFGATLAAAQEEPSEAQPAEESESTEEFSGLGRWYVHVEAWIAQPSGADLTVALRQSGSSSLGTQLETLSTGTETRGRYRLGYELRDNMGAFVATWFSTATDLTQQLLTPSTFQFLETNTAPLFQGAFDDGLSDGYQADAYLTVRDFRLSYYRNFPKTKHMRARWFIGYRRFSHNRSFENRYFALVPNFNPVIPPLSPPRPSLDPLPDRSLVESELSARGAEAGIEVDLPLWKDKVWIETGFSVAAMRGKVSSNYESRTYFYAFRGGGPEDIYQDPNDPGFLNDPDRIAQTFQEPVDLGISSSGEETGTGLIEGFLGVRWKVWRDLVLFGGYRGMFVDNAAEEFRVTAISANDELTQFNIVQYDRFKRSLTLEGYYLGVAVTF